jgi:hypothetical protein
MQARKFTSATFFLLMLVLSLMTNAAMADCERCEIANLDTGPEAVCVPWNRADAPYSECEQGTCCLAQRCWPCCTGPQCKIVIA